MSRIHFALCAALGTAVACSDDARQLSTAPFEPPTTAPTPAPAAEIAIGATAILEWNEVTTRFVELMSEPWPMAPASEALIYATVGVAVHDAVNAISPRYEHYAYAPLSRVSTDISVDAAIAAAAYTVLRDAGDRVANAPVFPTAAPLELATMHYVSVLNAIPAGEAKDVGMALGVRAGLAVLESRRDDSMRPAVLARFVSTGRPGAYRPTPPFASDAAQLSGLIDGQQWLGTRPLALTSLIEYRPPTPYLAANVEEAVHTDGYLADYREVKRIGGVSSHRTAAETELLHFWKDNSPRLWNAIARRLVEEQQLNGWDVARTLALVSLAGCDAYLAAYDGMYAHAFWRPVTAIRFADDDGNASTDADSTWEPASSSFDMPTPPSPEFTSAHATAGGAAARVLLTVLAESIPFSVVRASVTSPQSRTFESVMQAAQESAESGVLLGHHFRTSTSVGLQQGLEIGAAVVSRALRPLPPVRATR